VSEKDTANWDYEWKDSGREPQCAPNPAFPNGVDIDVADRNKPFCRGQLPYPARRCGHFIITCQRCGLCTAVTTAGRPDDPRSLTQNCKQVLQ
jgi:hypothetical protein